MKDLAAIILAAGRGTRMNSEVPKVLARLHERPILSFILNSLAAAGVEKKVLVVGYKEKAVKKEFPDLDTVLQGKPLGSGDAVKMTKNFFNTFKGDILVLYGDTPFIKKETISRLIKKHKEEDASCTILSSRIKNPSGYGRIVRGKNDKILKIIEDHEAGIYEKVIEEINVGCYCFKKEDLFSCVDKIKMNKEKREYYLTDVVELLTKSNKKVFSVECKDKIEYLGINSKLNLAEASDVVRNKILTILMLKGVTIIDPKSTFVDMDAEIGKDTVIRPNTIIEKNVTIGENCTVGPFARIRPGTVLSDNVEIGNFVELVRTKVSSGTKIKHMSYLGDAVIGKDVNVGAGTITANYDGSKKHKTIIEDNSFIGVGSIFVAPVKIGRGAVVGAGSVVTKNNNVPPHKTVVGVPAKILSKKKKKRSR